MPRTTLMERRAYDACDLDMPVTCPAGERIGERLEGPACKCRIEDSVITAARDGSSLALLCMGDFQMCPSWRAGRETEWENGNLADLLTGGGGLERSFSVEDLREIEERQGAGDLEGARAMATRIKDSHHQQARKASES